MAASSSARSKDFVMHLGEIAAMFDAIFCGLDDGQVRAYASSAGRVAIGKILPSSEIAWRLLEGSNAEALPDDWREFTFVMDNVAGHPAHKLPPYLLALGELDDCSPDQLAFLMMAATNAQGGRAAYWSLAEERLVQIQMADQSQFKQH